ncbi:response regulator [Rhodovulum sp. DZ06]|uniref:response regulator n=1 Tax=Rhodovulum sp. DZ06 TaxID=3425126 RepID=UPI003D358AAE
MKCLVADDNADLAELWAIALRADGHDVTCCTDGNQAVNQMRVQDFDLLVLDLFMPGGGALSLARVAVYNNPDAQVMVITGADCFAYGELLEMGDNIAMVLRKPVSPQDLRSFVTHLEHKRRAREDVGGSAGGQRVDQRAHRA